MGLMINNQGRKGNRPKIKRIEGFEIDHIIPYCISKDSSEENLQYLKHKEHLLKTILDKKIIKFFKERGWIEKVTSYSYEMKKPLRFLKEQYLVKFKELNEEISHDSHLCR